MVDSVNGAYVASATNTDFSAAVGKKITRTEFSCLYPSKESCLLNLVESKQDLGRSRCSH